MELRLRTVYIRIPFDVWPKLQELGVREYRNPKEQASALLVEAVERRYAELQAVQNDGHASRDRLTREGVAR